MANDYWEHRKLRQDIEEVNAQALAAHSRATQLRSELSQLRGSLEQRIDAMSKAFDAYVELGDLREQLAAFPDTAQARLQAVRAVQALADRRSPTMLDHGDGGYWLTHATNALIARAQGAPDPAAEERASELGGAEFELFWVVAAGAAGMGEVGADRLGAVLAGDGEFSEAQMAVFELLARGGYGPRVPVEALRSSLSNEPAQVWRDWLIGLGDSDAARLTVLGELTDPEHRTTEPEPVAATRFGQRVTEEPVPLAADRVQEELQEVMADLISNGFGEEAPLLMRIRELRAVVEHPDLAPESRQPKRFAVGPVIRTVLRLPTTDPQVRTQLLQAAREPIGEWIESVAQAPDPEPTAIRLNRGGMITVTAAGADRDELQRAGRSLAESIPKPNRWLLVGVGAVVFAAAVCFLVNYIGFGILLLLGAVGLGAYTAVSERNRRRSATDTGSVIAGLGTLVDEHAEKARATDEKNREERRRCRELAAELRPVIGAPSDPVPAERS